MLLSLWINPSHFHITFISFAFQLFFFIINCVFFSVHHRLFVVVAWLGLSSSIETQLQHCCITTTTTNVACVNVYQWNPTQPNNQECVWEFQQKPGRKTDRNEMLFNIYSSMILYYSIHWIIGVGIFSIKRPNRKWFSENPKANENQ